MVPVPSCPVPLYPQHFAAPPLVSAHVWKSPEVIATIPEVSPLTWTGVDEPVVVPFPSCPSQLPPQHFTAPPVVSAQVCQALAVMAMTPAVSPLTWTGIDESVVVPFQELPIRVDPST